MVLKVTEDEMCEAHLVLQVGQKSKKGNCNKKCELHSFNPHDI